jgi:hypothetical protein
MADGNVDEPSANGPLSIIIAFQSFPQGNMPRILQPKCLPALFLCYALQTQSITWYGLDYGQNANTD